MLSSEKALCVETGLAGATPSLGYCTTGLVQQMNEHFCFLLLRETLSEDQYKAED